LGGPNNPNETDDLDKLAGLEDKDGPNRPDNQDGAARPMTPHEFGGPDDLKVSGGSNGPDVLGRPNDPTDPLTRQA